MPENGVSLSTLWAVGTTAALAMVTAHQLFIRSFEEKSREHGSAGGKSQKRKAKRTRKPALPEADQEDADESTDSNQDVPPPPHRHPVPRQSQRQPAKTPGMSRQASPFTILNLDEAALEAGAKWGFSMREAREYAEQIGSSKRARTPQEVLDNLQKGNARFWTGAATRPEMSAFERRALIKQQFPCVAVLGCSDSRVPVEIVFDQGLGDLFVIRVAGNILDKATHGSLQYAIAHLKVKVVVVMGHEGCGAIKAAMLPKADLEKEPEQLSNLLQEIKTNLDETRLAWAQDMKARDREAVVINVKTQVAELTRDTDVMKLVDKQELLIVGAFYEISSGIVDFFHEVSNLEDATKAEPEKGDSLDAPQRLPSRGVMTRFDPATQQVTRQVTPESQESNDTM